MAKDKLPKLTEAMIRKLANEQSFSRGKSYYNGEAISDPILQGMNLRGQCEGSEYEPYDVSVTLDKNGVADMSCSCPYDWGGACKHIVALLLTYLNEPESFHAIPPVKTMLDGKSREELISIITDMINREPKLISIVELASATGKKGEAKAIEASAYRRQARRAMKSESPRIIEKELKSLSDTAARIARSGDSISAGTVYCALLEEAVRGYDDMVMSMDEDGDIAIIIDQIASGLGDCFKKSSIDHKTRRTWMEALLEAEMTDIEIGGIDLAPSASEAFIESVTEEDRIWVEEKLRARISKSGEWERETLVELLTEIQKKLGREGESAALIRALGTPEQNALLLVSEGEIEKALKMMRDLLKTKPGLDTQFADALVEAGAKDAALGLIMGQQKGWRSTGWLAEYYRKHGTRHEALEWQKRLFLESPSVEKFKELRDMSLKLKTWDQVRTEALNALEQGNRIDSLIEIALHEGDVAWAIKLLPRLARGWGYRDYKLEVAKAAEKDYPQEALAIYKQKAEEAIAGRSRDSYRQAAERLKRVKAIYTRLETKDEWQSYIQKLRTAHANLPALQDELKKAKL